MISRKALALAQLGQDPQYAWLTQPPRIATLIELGKIGQPEALRRVATSVCSLKLKTTAARVFILKARGKSRGPIPLSLTLSRALQQYAQTYPQAFLTVDVSQVLTSLATQYARMNQQQAA
jgi:hypothetical protein